VQETRDEPYVLTLLRAVGRRWKLVVACAVITPMVAYGLTLLQDEKYSASASLLFRDSGLSNTLFGQTVFAPSIDPSRAGQTNVELVSLAAISRRTADALNDGSTAKDIEGQIEVGAGSNADLVSVKATDPDRDRAAEIANTYVNEFIEFRREADRQKIADAQRLIEDEIEQLSPTDTDRGANLRERAEELQVLSALQTGNAEVVQDAVPPGQPSSPRPRRNVALGFILGLMLGSGLAIFLDRADRRMRTADDVTDLLGLPLLAAIPRSRALRRGAKASALDREGVAFQMLRTNLRYFNVDRQIRSVLVSSAAAGDGKSTVAWQLAGVEALAGQRVLLVEADLRNPSLHEVAGISPTTGLAEVLVREAELEDAIRSVAVTETSDGAEGQPRETVDVLLAGWKPPNPAQLIESEHMHSLLKQAEEEYDLVIVDTPPLSVVSDAIPLVNRVSGVVVVVRLVKNTRNALTALKDQLLHLGAPTLGVVVNDVTARGDSYDAYGYGMDPDAPKRGRRGRSRRSSERSEAGRTA
jgi:capsular exopolysaccharide synthesis family protein